MRRTPLKRKCRLKPRGRERGTPIPAYRAWIRTQACECRADHRDIVSPCEAAHLPRVKQHGDAQNLIPLCHKHHMEQHRIGRDSFAAKYGLDLEALALSYWEAWEAV